MCIFARVPVVGRVKRRLATAIGDAAACRAHDLLVQDTLARLAGVPGMTSELWLDAAPNDAAQGWLDRYPLSVRQQQGHDLGARMGHALGVGLQTAERVLLVGSDCPAVDAAYVQAAAERLQAVDVVLGPAEDGGYGLIGVRRSALGRLDTLFLDVAWGTGSVLSATLARAESAALAVELLATIWDVDDVSGWQRYLALSGKR